MTIANRSGYQAYQKNKYETASPHKLISLLYDAAIANIQRASRALDQQSITDARSFILKSQEIIYELMSCLNEEQGGDIASNLKQIYFYSINQLIQANIHKDTSMLKEVEGHISSLREAWNEIGKEVGLGARS